MDEEALFSFRDMIMGTGIVDTPDPPRSLLKLEQLYEAMDHPWIYVGRHVREGTLLIICQVCQETHARMAVASGEVYPRPTAIKAFRVVSTRKSRGWFVAQCPGCDRV